MRPSRSVLAIASITIDSLNSIIFAAIASWWIRLDSATTRTNRSKILRLLLLILYQGSRLTRRKEIGTCWRFRTRAPQLLDSPSLREVFCDLNLDITKISLTSIPLALLLVGVFRFWCAGRTPFKPAIPIVRDKRFFLVFLGRAMRVDVVYMGKVSLESREATTISECARTSIRGYRTDLPSWLWYHPDQIDVFSTAQDWADLAPSSNC